VTTVPSGVDLVILPIETAYDVRGLTTTVKTYNAPTSGIIVTQVSCAYNDFQQSRDETQAHG
jgi:hypothetical protein